MPMYRKFDLLDNVKRKAAHSGAEEVYFYNS